MAFVLIDPKAPLWRNVIGVVAAIVLVPLAIVAKLVTLPFERPRVRSADEVVRYLRNFIAGAGGDWDFDDFTSIPIADRRLDSIRERAARIEELASKEGLSTLRVLLAEAEEIAQAERGANDAKPSTSSASSPLLYPPNKREEER